jgi:glycosyltransferase involved in cell wall biosynthesis
VGLLSMFCRRHGKPFVFRVASDSDCDPARLLVRYARDCWLYALGLRRADVVLVQSEWQARALAQNYGVTGCLAKMLVDAPRVPAAERDIDVLWVSNIRRVKRPDRVLRIAQVMPWLNFHLVGGPLAGEEVLFEEVHETAARLPNVFFHGRQAYEATNALYSRARLFLNTSDVEGFPNSYLQAWIRGVPVVSLFDPDGVIRREGLGRSVAVADELAFAIGQLTQDPRAWARASEACLAYMAREHGEEAALAPYLEAFEQAGLRRHRADARLRQPTDAAHG